MIATGNGCKHGTELTNYITKNERADIIKTNHLNTTTSSYGMWHEMQLHYDRFSAQFGNRKVKNPAVRFELSPSAEECKDWSDKEWADILDEFFEILDSTTEFKNSKGKEFKLKKTNFRDTQYFAGLHHDSKSGHLHLHVLTNRVDINGKPNDIHNIGERCVEAARILNLRHGWKDAMVIRQEHLDHFHDECISVLQEMKLFDVDDYIKRLQARGHEMHINRDSNGKVRGYSFKQPGCTDKWYKASDLGKGRHLTVANLQRTWIFLHGYDFLQRPTSSGNSGQQYGSTWGQQTYQPKDNRLSYNGATESEHPLFYNGRLAYGYVPVRFKKYSFFIPAELLEIMEKEVKAAEELTDVANKVVNTASLLFMGYIDAATHYVQSFGGGGSSDSGGWRDKDDDEDWKKFAHRCAVQACSMSKKPSLSRSVGKVQQTQTNSRGRKK